MVFIGKGNRSGFERGFRKDSPSGGGEIGTVNVHRLHPIARLSKDDYTRCRDIFEMVRPA